MIINPKIEDIKLTNIIGLDTEFKNLDAKNSYLIAISITNTDGFTYVLERINYSVGSLIDLFKRIRDNVTTVICHNAKIDAAVIYANSGVLFRNTYCTMLGSQIIDNGRHDPLKMVGNQDVKSPHSLIGCVKRYLNITLMEEAHKTQLRNSFIKHNPGEKLTLDQLHYAGSDTVHLIPLYKEQIKHIEEKELGNIVAMENKLTPVLIKMEFNGPLVDVEKHKQNINDWEHKRRELMSNMDSIILVLSQKYPAIYGGKFTNARKHEAVTQLDIFGAPSYVSQNSNIHNLNYSSSKQLVDLFNRLELPLPVDEENKPSFSEDNLNKYLTTYPDSIMKDFIINLIDFKEYDKLISTYGQTFLNLLDSENRLRTNYTQCFTDTGRLSSTQVVKGLLGANLANIPTRSDLRNIFIPDPGYSFVDCDMTGQEVAIAADFSKEPVLLKALKEGFDHHSFLASGTYSIIFDRPVEVKNTKDKVVVDGFEYTLKDLRNDHKACLFAKFYSGGANRVADILSKYLSRHVVPELRMEKCKQISDVINRNLPVLIKHLKKTVDDSKIQGFTVANKLGRRRYYDDPENYYGEIMNFPVQGTGADAIKISLIKLDKWFNEKSKELGIEETELGWISLTVYDQNLCCLNDNYIELAPEIQKIMGESLSYFLTEITGSSDMQIKKKWSK